MVALSTIMRHDAQHRQVAAQIREANSIIDSASKGAEAAAQELCSNWAGDARDAFLAEQVKAKSWWEQMIQIIAELASTIDKVNSAYSTAEQTVKDTIGSH